MDPTTLLLLQLNLGVLTGCLVCVFLASGVWARWTACLGQQKRISKSGRGAPHGDENNIVTETVVGRSNEDEYHCSGL